MVFIPSEVVVGYCFRNFFLSGCKLGGFCKRRDFNVVMLLSAPRWRAGELASLLIARRYPRSVQRRRPSKTIGFGAIWAHHCAHRGAHLWSTLTDLLSRRLALAETKLGAFFTQWGGLKCGSDADSLSKSESVKFSDSVKIHWIAVNLALK